MLSRIASSSLSSTLISSTTRRQLVPALTRSNYNLLSCGECSTACQVRWKHSSRQIKRLFKKNPARARVEARMGVDRTPPKLDPPNYAPILEPTFLPNGWTPPPPPDVEVPEYPFSVARTGNKPNNAPGFLPVYSNTKIGGTKVTTRIKKVSGDRDAFLAELRSVLNLPPSSNPRDDAIRIRTGGTIEVNGNRVRQVKEWLAGLGF